MFLIVVLLGLISLVIGKVILTVKPGASVGTCGIPPHECRTITEALQYITDEGDEILIPNNYELENAIFVNIPGVVIKGVSSGSSKPTVFCSASRRYYTIVVTADRVTFQNLRFDVCLTQLSVGNGVKQTNLIDLEFVSGSSATGTDASPTVDFNGATDISIRNCHFHGEVLQPEQVYQPGLLMEGVDTATIKNSVFSNSLTGLSVKDSSKITILDSTFISNSLSGLQCSGSSQLTITNTNFSNNTGAHGGAILAEVSGPATISGCSFNGNRAPKGLGRGGAIEIAHFLEPWNIDSSSFNDNHVDGMGGSVSILNGTATVTMTNCNISSSSARQGGGVSLSSAALTQFDSVIFRQNLGTLYGGAVFSILSSSEMLSSIFSNNTSPTGGAITQSRGSLHITDSTIAGNTGTREGGGIQLFSTNLTLTSTDIYGNIAPHGPAIAVEEGGFLEFISSSIWQNFASSNNPAATASIALAESYWGFSISLKDGACLCGAPTPSSQTLTCAAGVVPKIEMKTNDNIFGGAATSCELEDQMLTESSCDSANACYLRNQEQLVNVIIGQVEPRPNQITTTTVETETEITTTSESTLNTATDTNLIQETMTDGKKQTENENNNNNNNNTPSPTASIDSSNAFQQNQTPAPSSPNNQPVLSNALIAVICLAVVLCVFLVVLAFLSRNRISRDYKIQASRRIEYEDHDSDIPLTSATKRRSRSGSRSSVSSAGTLYSNLPSVAKAKGESSDSLTDTVNTTIIRSGSSGRRRKKKRGKSADLHSSCDKTVDPKGEEEIAKWVPSDNDYDSTSEYGSFVTPNQTPTKQQPPRKKSQYSPMKPRSLFEQEQKQQQEEQDKQQQQQQQDQPMKPRSLFEQDKQQEQQQQQQQQQLLAIAVPADTASTASDSDYINFFRATGGNFKPETERMTKLDGKLEAVGEWKGNGNENGNEKTVDEWKRPHSDTVDSNPKFTEEDVMIAAEMYDQVGKTEGNHNVHNTYDQYM